MRRKLVLLAVLLAITTAAPIHAAADYLSGELARTVAELRKDVEEAPTSASTLAPRTAVLWRWANAYALQGRPIDPELTAICARVLRRESGNPAALRRYAGYVDGFVRELGFRDDHPTAIGELTTDFLGPFPVDEFATFTIRYSVGSAPIGAGGGLLLASRAYGGGTDLQWTDPKRDGYVTATASNPRVRLRADPLEVAGMFSGQLGGSRGRPFFRVTQGRLEPGDVVIVTIGDTSGGSRGILVPAASSTGIRFRGWVKLDEDSTRFALHELPFFSVGGATLAVRGLAPSVVAVSEPVTLRIRSEDGFRNRATGSFPRYHVMDGGRRLGTVFDTSRALNDLTVTFPDAGARFLTVVSDDGRIRGEFNPILVAEDPETRIFWGETHGHSGFAEGSGTVDGFFEFAREDARLDFATLSEHDLWMDDREWVTLRGAVRRHHRPDEFVTFLGYEWTAPPHVGGHHNVLFRTPDERRRVEGQRTPDLADLYRLLRAENDDVDVLVIPHAHNPGRWWQSAPEVERLVEIVSNHGTFEWLGRAYLAEGFRLGFIGGSDDHVGHPGLRPLRREPGSDNFGGLAGVRAAEKSRDALFDALRNRRAYATNGQRIILDHAMHEADGEPRRVTGRVVGTAPIESITLVRDGEDVKRQIFVEPAAGMTDIVELRVFSDSDPLERDARSRGARPWRGSIAVQNARLERVETPNLENVYTESARVSVDDPNRAEFFLRSRGAARGLRLHLSGVSETTRLVFSSRSRDLEVAHTFSAATMARGEEVIVAADGAHQDQVSLRFIEFTEQRDRHFAFVDAAGGNDSYYVRVVQTDGGMAWSSPWWATRH